METNLELLPTERSGYDGPASTSRPQTAQTALSRECTDMTLPGEVLEVLPQSAGAPGRPSPGRRQNGGAPPGVEELDAESLPGRPQNAGAPPGVEELDVESLSGRPQSAEKELVIDQELDSEKEEETSFSADNNTNDVTSQQPNRSHLIPLSEVPAAPPVTPLPVRQVEVLRGIETSTDLQDELNGSTSAHNNDEPAPAENSETPEIENVPENVPETEPQSRANCCGKFHIDLEGAKHRIDNKVEQWKGLSTKIRALILCCCILSLMSITFISLMCVSLQYIHFNQVALPFSKITKAVDRSDLRYAGCYLLGLDTELLIFDTSVQFVDATITITTADMLLIDIDVSLQYQIRPEEVPDLFGKFHLDYGPIIRSVAMSTLKNTVGPLTTKDFIRRLIIESTLKAAIQDKLQGDCCSSCCPGNCGNSSLCDNCILEDDGCNHGYHVDVKSFQLQMIHLPDILNDRFLQQILAEVEVEKATYSLELATTKAYTNYLLQSYYNQVRQIDADAVAQGNLIRSKAEVFVDKVKQNATVEGLRVMYDAFNITQDDHRLSMYLISTMDKMDNLYKAVDFEEKSFFTGL